MRRHTSRPSRWQKTARLSHNCLLPGAALHHWPPVPALHLGGGSSESKGEPSSARPDHITQGSGLWCGSDRERTNPGPQPHRPAQCRPRPVVSSLWKNIFECLVHSLTFTPPHAALIYLGFSEGGGGGVQSMPLVVTSCSEGMHAVFHRVSLLDRRFWCVLVGVGKS